MELANYLIEDAQKVLQYEGEKKLPQQLANTEFYLAHADDHSFFAFGSIKHNGAEYKIGTKKKEL